MTDTPNRTGYMRAIEDAATAATRDIHTRLTEFIHLAFPPSHPRLHTKEQTTMTNTPNPGIERNVVPEFWSTPGINKTCPDARLLFLAMHTFADDHGRGLRDPDALKRHAFPRDPIVTPERVSELLHQIRAVFPVTYYTVNGRDYYQIDDWADTQYEPDMEPVHPSPDHPEATHIH